MKKIETHGSLFSGRGGFDVAAQRCSIKTLWNCEQNTWLRHKLKRIDKDAKQYTDVRTATNLQQVDIITAGFPCQDISISNWQNKKGIKGSRSGLWSEVKRIANVVKPGFLILENSSNLAKQGLEIVLSDLYEIGYNAEWCCLRAEQFGFPHKRERMYIIAYSNSFGLGSPLFRPLETVTLSQKWTPTASYVRVASSRTNGYADIRAIQRGDVVPNFGSEIHAYGNAVMPIIAEYLFKCVLMAS